MTRIGTKVFGACLGIGLSWLAGCDGGEPRTLTAADVQGMMTPGNASGMLFSGTYTTTTAALDACKCRSGSCAAFHPETGGLSVAVQTDGVLTINEGCIGGVNTDGTFWCGGSMSLPEGGIDLGIDTGTFTLSGGKPTGLQVAEEITFVGTIDGVAHDCDIRGHATARLVAP